MSIYDIQKSGDKVIQHAVPEGEEDPQPSVKITVLGEEYEIMDGKVTRLVRNGVAFSG